MPKRALAIHLLMWILCRARYNTSYGSIPFNHALSTNRHSILAQIAATADYVFTWYGNNNGANGSGSVVNTSPIPLPVTTGAFTSAAQSTMSAQSFMLGINYYFNQSV